MTIKKSVLRYACVLMVVLAIPTMAAAENNGVRYYVSLGTSLSVGIQPDASGENQETDEGYADQLFDIIEPNFSQDSPRQAWLSGRDHNDHDGRRKMCL